MFEIIISSIATFGISALISNYDGPGEILFKLRKKVPLTRCTICLGVWAGIPIAYFMGVGIIGYLAIIGLVILVERLT